MSLRHKSGFFISGMINNYNFIMIFACAYYFSQNSKYINPSLLIFTEIVPGFLTQLIYPIFIYKLSYTFRFVLLYILQLVSSICLMIRSDENQTLLFFAIILVSINSYLGESSILSLSSSYEHKEMKFWSIGTGLAGLLGTGGFLLLNLWLKPKIIFAINLVIYLIGFSIGLFLLDYRNHTRSVIDLETIPSQPVPLDDFDLGNSEASDTVATVPQNMSFKDKVYHQIHFFRDILFLCFGYFLGYFIGFLYVPALSSNNLDYQILQFITRSAQFLGRCLGNYLPKYFNDAKQRYYSLIHIYTLLLLIVYSILITKNIHVPLGIVILTLIISYIIIGISYPIVYNYIYETYIENRPWYLGSVGQYTSFFTILGCILGYPIHLAWKK